MSKNVPNWTEDPHCDNTFLYTSYLILRFPRWLGGKKKPTCQVSLVVHTIKNLPGRRRQQEMQITSLDWEDPLEKGMVTHSSIFAWRIPWTEKSMKSQKVRHG